MSFEGAIQGNESIPYESPSEHTDQTVEAATDSEQVEAQKSDPVFFIGDIASAKIPMTPVEFQALLTSIDEDGQEVNITVRKTGDGRLEVIDGTHRYNACLNLGKRVKFVEVTGSDEEMRALSDRLNDKRRHLTQARLAKWVVDRTLANPEGRPPKNSAAAAEISREQLARELGVNVTDIKPRDELAQLKGVSTRSVQMAAQIKKASPQIYKKIDSEGLSLEEALKQARKEQREADQGANQSEPSEKEVEKAVGRAVEKVRQADQGGRFPSLSKG